jgi:hypothetical protein
MAYLFLKVVLSVFLAVAVLKFQLQASTTCFLHTKDKTIPFYFVFLVLES